jgi:hypothetical protein
MEMTFNNLADRWEKAEGPDLKSSTLAHYTNALRAYVRPHFGERNIKDITKEDIKLFLNEKAKNYSKSSLRSMRVVLGLTLAWANDNGWLDRYPLRKDIFLVHFPQACATVATLPSTLLVSFFELGAL